MSESDHNQHTGETSSPEDQPAPRPSDTALASPLPHVPGTDTRRWWIKLVIQPVLFLVCGAILIVALGIAQRAGFISAGGSSGGGHSPAASQSVSYICPMMCTPPQTEPGRCPVCAMELVPATSDGGDGDSRSIQIDPAARRVANIQTIAVRAVPMSRTIRAIGELSYDEGTLKTISAYVDGRIERLYADYTGVVVQKGDQLAILYSPELYSSQVELLLARKSRDESRTATLQRVVQSAHDLYENARRRLVELGVTEEQIQQLEQAGEANSRLHLCAPSSGTVIEKLAVEGQYVQEGDAIYKLADLSTVWLMLKLFPEDAAAVRYGQKVEARVQSLPGRVFAGRVAFIDPRVDPKTRTVGVRVVIPNDRGLLRIGDYAKAAVEVPVGPTDDPAAKVYDAELANKWISPRHPHVIEASPGKCRECGVELIPASRLGFTDKPAAAAEAHVVPRDAVLMAGNHSVVYVETEPGRFEIRRVVLGPSRGDEVVLLSGVTAGDLVATRGNFLIDSQMQLAGNPSLIDPTRDEPAREDARTAEMIAALSDLSPADRTRAEHQQICPVTELPLGSMGPPPKVDVNGMPVFICCDGCRQSLLAEPEMYLARLASRRVSEPARPGEVQMDLPPIGAMQMIDSSSTSPTGEGGESPVEVHGQTHPTAAPLQPTELPREGLR